MSLVPGNDDLLPLLPGDGVPEGWARSDEARVFPGDALFSHINGGAELYLDYGFDRLVVQDYLNGKLEARVEIYAMSDADGASGIFGENSKGIEVAEDYGAACTLDDYQIVFHRGRYYVSITCYETMEEIHAAMKALAGAVDKAIIDEGVE